MSITPTLVLEFKKGSMEDMPGPGPSYSDCVNFLEFTNPYGAPSLVNPLGLVGKKKIDMEHITLDGFICIQKGTVINKTFFISIDLAIITFLIYLGLLIYKKISEQKP